MKSIRLALQKLSPILILDATLFSSKVKR